MGRVRSLGWIYWLTRGRVHNLGWGLDIKLPGRYLTIAWRPGPFRAHISPNGTPWHHAARRLWPLRRWLQLISADCSCGAVDCPRPKEASRG